MSSAIPADEPAAPPRAPLAQHLYWRRRLAAGWPDAARMLCAAMLAYLIAHALGLREAYWAVLTALITGRAQAGGTARAGAERLVATVVGAALAAAVAAARAWHIDSGVLLFVVLAPLCLLVALQPAYRTAPIAALIVLSSGPAAGLGAFGTALLRTIEIALGALASLAVSLVVFPARARARARDHAAVILHRLAELVRARADEHSETLREQLRADLRELGVLARSSGWRKRSGGDAERLLRVLMALHGDVGFLLRALGRKPLRDLDAERAAALALRLDALAARLDAAGARCGGGAAPVPADADTAREGGIADYLVRCALASLAAVEAVLESPRAARTEAPPA